MNEPLSHDIVLDCSVEHAFETFTRRVNLWWPLGHRRFEVSTFYCDPKPGGMLTEVSDTGDKFVWADLIQVDPPTSLVFAWHPGKNTTPTRTDILFQSFGRHATRILLTHSEGDAALGPDWSKRAILFNRGWTAVLTAIQGFIKTEGERR